MLWDKGPLGNAPVGSPTDGGNAPQWFTTPPDYDSPTKLRFWALGDMGTGQREQLHVRDAALGVVEAEGRPADMFLALGGMHPTPPPSHPMSHIPARR